MIAGGDPEGTAEVFDPDAFSFTRASSRMSNPRWHHSAILLNSGEVLITGGQSQDGDQLHSAEIFDSASLRFRDTRNAMLAARIRPALKLLPDGKVLIIGGDQERSIEVFNADGGYFTARVALVPDSSSDTRIGEVLRATTRAALIHDRSSLISGAIGNESWSRGRKFRRVEDHLDRDQNLEDLLDRSGHTITEIPQTSTALIAGGKTSAGITLASAMTISSSSATVTTDKSDYSPGERVLITGTNWLPGETVELTLHRDNDTLDTLLRAVTDQDGNLSNSDYVIQEGDLDVAFLVTAVGQSSGFTAQTSFTDASDNIRQIAFNATNQPADFTVGLSNSTSRPLRVQSQNISGTGESVTLSGQSITINVTSNSATGRFDTTTGGSFAASSLTLQILQGSQNTPDFFYRDTTSGSVTFTATVSAKTSALTNLAVGSTASITKNVIKAGTTTSVTASASPGECRASVTFIATVAHSSGGAGSPTGTVIFKDGVNTLGAGTLGTGPPFNASLATSALPVGPHSITAVYAGDGNFTGSTSAPFTLPVADTTAPVITLIGANPMTVECHGNFVDPGATAIDACIGDVTAAIIVTGSVNPNAVSSYTLTYTVSDGPEGNTASVSRAVNVVDTTKPVISLIGAATMTVDCHTAFTDPGATATDTCAGDLTGSIVVAGTVDANIAGSYTIHYNVSDPSGNAAIEVNRTVIVQDTTRPIITLNGPNPFNVECHGIFIDPGATASDACDATLATATPAGAVDVNVPGDYIITYSASDASGNSATPVNRTVRVQDTTPPMIVLNGPNPITIECHSSFTDPGANATDSCAGIVPVVSSGSIDVLIPGNYTITYSASDGQGNTATRTRTVYVRDTIKPVISLNGPNPMIVTLGASFADPGATASDGCAGSLDASVVVSGSVDPSVVGTYVLTYNVSDPSGNAADPVTRTVEVRYSSTCGRTILPPINSDGSSVFKQKATVPAKFRVCGANGMSIGTPGVVSAFNLVQTISGTYIDAVNEPVDSTTPDTVFRWDPVEEQWVFNINTKGLAANKTYVFRISLNDRTCIDLQFGLK